MKRFGVREICNVVFRATAPMELGGKKFFKGEPVLFFNSLKTSSLEGAATTVYAQGGRGNTRLMSWDGEKTLTFTMEDALITADSFALLAAAKGEKIKDGKVHTQKRLGVVTDKDPARTYAKVETNKITLNEEDALGNVAAGDIVYVLAADEGGFNSEPFLFQVGTKYTKVETEPEDWADNYKNYFSDDTGTAVTGESAPTFADGTYYRAEANAAVLDICTKDIFNDGTNYTAKNIDELTGAEAIYLDYYTGGNSLTRLTIEPDNFGANFYIEAETLFRDENGSDAAAIFTIPNSRVQSNFTITMASSGDPSSFTFTMDAFPGYTRFNQTDKILASLDIMDTTSGQADDRKYRMSTNESTI